MSDVWDAVCWGYYGDKLAPVVLKLSETDYVVLDAFGNDPMKVDRSRCFPTLEEAIDAAAELSDNEEWKRMMQQDRGYEVKL